MCLGYTQTIRYRVHITTPKLSEDNRGVIVLYRYEAIEKLLGIFQGAFFVYTCKLKGNAIGLKIRCLTVRIRPGVLYGGLAELVTHHIANVR